LDGGSNNNIRLVRIAFDYILRLTRDFPDASVTRAKLSLVYYAMKNRAIFYWSAFGVNEAHLSLDND